VNKVELPSGCIVERPLERMLAFCKGEFAYYDAIPSADPNRIDPLDVLATVAVNAFSNATASKIYRVHQGLKENCEPVLPAIPQDADLIDLHLWQEPLRELLHAAVQARDVLIPVATKVLHRKRRFLIPMLDNVLLHYYFGTPEQKKLLAASQSKAKAADVGMEALGLFRTDLVAAKSQIEIIRTGLFEQGFPLSPVRILEVLLWTEVEPMGGYREIR
jgi:Family of unknown function (DUF6308)